MILFLIIVFIPGSEARLALWIFLISLKKRSTANTGVAYMFRILLLMLYEIIDDIRIGQKILIFSTLRKVLSLKEKTYLTSFSAINWYYF